MAASTQLSDDTAVHRFWDTQSALGYMHSYYATQQLHGYLATQLWGHTDTGSTIYMALLHCYGLHSYKDAQLQGCTVTRMHSYRAAQLQGCTVTGLHSYWAAQLRATHLQGCTGMGYGVAQLRGCTGTCRVAGLHSYEAAQVQGCVGTRLRRGYGYGAAQVRVYNSCEAAQVWGCTGTGMHRYRVAHLRGCTLARLHKYRVAQVRRYTDIYGATQLGATQPFKMGPTQPKINLYSMRKILWPSCTRHIHSADSVIVQERLAVQLKHTGMLQAFAFSSVPGMYFFRSGTSMLQFKIQE